MIQILNLFVVQNMEWTHNIEEWYACDKERNTQTLNLEWLSKNSDVYGILKHQGFTSELIWPIKTFLARKEFSVGYENMVENIRCKLRESYIKVWFLSKDTNDIIEIIDKLYDYLSEHKKSNKEKIDKLKNRTELIDMQYRSGYIQQSRDIEEYLIEMLQMKHNLGSWIGTDGFKLLDCSSIKVENKKLGSLKEENKDKPIKIDVGHQLNIQSRQENLILNYFWSFESQSKYLDELEKEYHDNLVKNDELFRKKEKKSYTNLETLEKEMESLKRDRYGIITKMSVAKLWIRDYKEEIYRLIEKFGIILSEDLCSKLGKYPEFSELLIENNRILSTTEEAEAIEVEW